MLKRTHSGIVSIKTIKQDFVINCVTICISEILKKNFLKFRIINLNYLESIIESFAILSKTIEFSLDDINKLYLLYKNFSAYNIFSREKLIQKL